MMTQKEKYSLHLPYGLKCLDYGECDGIRDWIGWGLEFKDKYGSIDVPISAVKPYLRNLSDLTKPITQKDYNDGNPFVPIEYLKEYLVKIDGDNYGLEYKGLHGNEYFKCPTFRYAENENISLMAMPFHFVQQLLKWHFAIGFEQGEYIEVTKENNPY